MPDEAPPPPPPKVWRITPSAKSGGGEPYQTSDREVLSEALRRGDAVQSIEEGVARAEEAGKAARYEGVAGGAKAATEGALRGVTFGLSDVVASAAGNQYDVEDIKGRRAAHPTVSTVAEIAGSVAPALLSGGAGAAGAAARLTPAGRAAALAARITESGAAGGIVKKTATAAAGAALEGGAQSAGSYLSDVALGDKKLSAEGFLGAAGKGAALGGAIGGGAALTERGLTAAKRLFPSSTASKEAADAAGAEVASALDKSLGDARTAEVALEGRAAAARQARVSVDPEAAARAARAEAEAAIPPPPAAAPPPSPAIPEQVPPGIAALRAGDTGAGRAATLEDQLSDTLIGLDGGGLVGSLRSRPTPAGARPAATTPLAAPAIDVPTGPAIGRTKLAPGTLKKPAADVPNLDALKKRIEVAEGDFFEEVVDPKALASRGWADAPTPTAGVDDATIRASVGADGKITVLGGRDKLEQAIAAEMPVRVRWTPASEAVADDAARAADAASASRAARNARGKRPAAPADLEAQLEATLAGVKAGDSLNDLAAAAKRTEAAVDNAVGDAVSIESRAAARELRAASDELDAVIREQRAATTTAAAAPRKSLASSPLVSRSVGLETIDAGEDIATALTKALRSGTPDAVDDIAKVVPAIQRFEAAEQRAAAALGDAAPPGLRERVAQQERSAVAHRNLVELGDVRAAQDIGRTQSGAFAEAMAAAGKPGANAAYPAASGLGVLDAAAPKGALGKALDAGAALEVLAELGIPGLPNVNSIPVVGPMLGLYLKARAAARVFGKFGGKVPTTVETRVAKTAAATRDRMIGAVHQMLDAGARGARGVRPVSLPVAEVLSRPFFGGKSRDEDARASFKRAVADLDKLSTPGAMRDAIRKVAPTSNSELAQHMEDVAQRKLDYLQARAPRPPIALTSPFSTLVDDWHPTKSEIEKFARIKQAVDDPAGVLESAISGDISMEAVDALRTVYPAMYEEARMTLLKSAIESGGDMPRGRRVQMSILFDVPLDPTLMPRYIADAQAVYEPPQPQQDPSAGGMPSAPPAPGLAGNANFAARAALPGETPR